MKVPSDKGKRTKHHGRQEYCDLGFESMEGVDTWWKGVQRAWISTSMGLEPPMVTEMAELAP